MSLVLRFRATQQRDAGRDHHNRHGSSAYCGANCPDVGILACQYYQAAHHQGTDDSGCKQDHSEKPQ